MADIDVEKTLLELSLDEKVALTAGRDFWHTQPVPRLGVPSLRLSDGPNGLRGVKFFNSTPAACLPCGTGLGATWDVSLVQELGDLLGLEAKAKGVHVILGPTVNIQRSPLGGRGFESFAEDPVLSGLLGAAYCNGVQSQDIMTTIKHFVCNDQEDRRMSVDVKVSERALREIYLLPFMLAVRDSNPATFMTAYNKVNGTHVSERKDIIDDILRKEWGWDGLVMSDWYGTYSTVNSLKAGLDLEMPGPPRWRTCTVANSVVANTLPEDVIDERVRNILKLVKRAAKSGIREGQIATTRNVKETSALLRRAASESIVLMKNDENILPLKNDKTIAVIGPNAKTATYCGGGSASLTAYYAVSPLEGVQAQCSDVKFSQGCYSHKELPLLDNLLKTADGRKGLIFRAYNDTPDFKGRECVDEIHVTSSYFFLTDYYQTRLKSSLFYAEIESYLQPEKNSIWDFGLSVQGTAKLFIDGKEVVDNATKQLSGTAFFGAGTREEQGSIELKAGKTYRLLVQFASAPTSKLVKKGVTVFRKGGVRLGGCPRIKPEEAIEQAVKLAKETDQVVLFAGLNGDWESEGHDRETMDLPPYSDILISKVLAVNPNAVVVIQSGTPVAMPWISQCKALLHAWYGGNETGNGIADVIFGKVNPSGKLPLTFPVRVQDNPAFLNSKSEKGRMIYGEDVYVGYRYYEKISLPVLFPFGHGLSYTTFSLHSLSVLSDGVKLSVSVEANNTGKIDGAVVAQVYVSATSPSVTRANKELKGWKKVFLRAGESKRVEVEIPVKYAISFWDESKHSWSSEAGMYKVLVGESSQGDFLTRTFFVEKDSWWKGL